MGWMMAGMLTQVPLLPAGAAEIAPGVWLVTGDDGGGLVSEHGLATFACDAGMRRAGGWPQCIWSGCAWSARRRSRRVRSGPGHRVGASPAGGTAGMTAPTIAVRARSFDAVFARRHQDGGQPDAGTRSERIAGTLRRELPGRLSHFKPR